MTLINGAFFYCSSRSDFGLSFCSDFGLLDIASPSLCEELIEFVSKEQQALRRNLKRALIFMDLIDEETTEHKMLTLMFLLESGKLALNVDVQVIEMKGDS